MTFITRSWITFCLFVAAFPAFAQEGLFESTPISRAVNAKEGPVVDAAGNLYFCSLTGKDGRALNPRVQGAIGILRVGATETETLMELPEGMHFNGLRITPWGTLVGADSVGKRVGEVNLKTLEISTFFQFPEESDRPNDVAITRSGVVYVSLPPRAIWRLERAADGTVSGRLVGESFANGVEVSLDEKYIYTNSGILQVGDDGLLSRATDRRLRIPNDRERYSFSDGMRFDQSGRLFMARAGGRSNVDGKVVRQPAVIHVFAPDGTLERDVVLPFPSVTNLAFGGPDGKTVYTVHGNDGIASFRTDVPGRSFGLYE